MEVWHLQVKLEEKVQEVDSLTSKIQELEVQLNKEREENKRFNTEISKIFSLSVHLLF